MLIALYIILGIGMLGWMLGMILAVIGRCKVEWGGEEHWESEKCEWIYYYITAPISCIAMITGIILCCIIAYT